MWTRLFSVEGFFLRGGGACEDGRLKGFLAKYGAVCKSVGIFLRNEGGCWMAGVSLFFFDIHYARRPMGISLPSFPFNLCCMCEVQARDDGANGGARYLSSPLNVRCVLGKNSN